MTRAEIESKLAGVFKSVFPALSDEEIRRASPASVAEWDSVAVISLMNAIEDEFGFELPLDDAAGLSSFELIADYLEERLADG